MSISLWIQKIFYSLLIWRLYSSKSNFSSLLTMSNKQTRTKGNKTTEVDEIIPFWNPIFFDEDDEEETKLKTVEIPILIDAMKGDKRSNTTKYEVPAIEYFESNVEVVLSAMDLIEDQIMESVRTGVYSKALKSKIGY